MYSKILDNTTLSDDEFIKYASLGCQNPTVLRLLQIIDNFPERYIIEQLDMTIDAVVREYASMGDEISSLEYEVHRLNDELDNLKTRTVVQLLQSLQDEVDARETTIARQRHELREEENRTRLAKEAAALSESRLATWRIMTSQP